MNKISKGYIRKKVFRLCAVASAQVLGYDLITKSYPYIGVLDVSINIFNNILKYNNYLKIKKL